MIDLLHFEDTDDKLVANVAENSSVAFPAILLQAARAAAVIVILERSVKIFVPFDVLE